MRYVVTLIQSYHFFKFPAIKFRVRIIMRPFQTVLHNNLSVVVYADIPNVVLDRPQKVPIRAPILYHRIIIVFQYFLVNESDVLPTPVHYFLRRYVVPVEVVHEYHDTTEKYASQDMWGETL